MCAVLCCVVLCCVCHLHQIVRLLCPSPSGVALVIHDSVFVAVALTLSRDCDVKLCLCAVNGQSVQECLRHRLRSCGFEIVTCFPHQVDDVSEHNFLIVFVALGLRGQGASAVTLFLVPSRGNEHEVPTLAVYG